VVVECDLVSDGHDAIGGRALFRHAGSEVWQTATLEPPGDDRLRAPLVPRAIGRWEITFEARIDAYTKWRRGTEKKRAAGLEVSVELLIGAKLIKHAAARAEGPARALLAEAARLAADEAATIDARLEAASGDLVVRAMAETPDL